MKKSCQHFYLTNPLSELRMQCSPHEDGSIVPLSSPFKRPKQTIVTPFHQALWEIIYKTRHTDESSRTVVLHILIIFDCMLPRPKQSRDGLSHNHFFKQKMKMEREKTEGEKSKKMDSEKMVKEKSPFGSNFSTF